MSDPAATAAAQKAAEAGRNQQGQGPSEKMVKQAAEAAKEATETAAKNQSIAELDALVSGLPEIDESAPVLVKPQRVTEEIADREFSVLDVPPECTAIATAVEDFKTKQLEKLKTNAKEYVKTSDKAIVLIKTQKDLIDKLIKGKEGEKGDLTTQLENLQVQIANCDGEKQGWLKEKEKLEIQIQELQNSLELKNKEIDNWRGVATNLQSEIDKTDKKLMQVMALGDKVSDELAALETVDFKTAADADKLANLQTQLEKRRVALESKVTELALKLKNCIESSEQSVKDSSGIQESLNKSLAAYQKVLAQLTKLQEDRVKLEKQITACASALESQKQKYVSFCQQQAAILGSLGTEVDEVATSLDAQIVALSNAVTDAQTALSSTPSSAPAASEPAASAPVASESAEAASSNVAPAQA